MGADVFGDDMEMGANSAFVSDPHHIRVFLLTFCDRIGRIGASRRRERKVGVYRPCDICVSMVTQKRPCRETAIGSGSGEDQKTGDLPCAFYQIGTIDTSIGAQPRSLRECGMSNRRNQSLRGITILRDLSDDDRAELERSCRWARFNPGELVLSHLERSDDVFFLVSGTARALIYSAAGKAVMFRDIQSGGMFGQFAAIDGKPRSATVEALVPCLIAIMPATVFWHTIENQSQFTLAVLRQLISYIRELTDRVFEFSTLAVNNRVHAELLRLARANTCDGVSAEISPCPKHSEIASRISTHREAVTREVNRLVQMELVERYGKTLRVTDLPRLERMVREATGE
ncbi:MAG: Crp/Fnr family transcriptional regulator [Hyphomicrobiales bacterium]